MLEKSFRSSVGIRRLFHLC